MAPSNTRSERIASRNGVSRRVGLIRLCYRARCGMREMTFRDAPADAMAAENGATPPGRHAGRILVVDAKRGESQKSAALETGSIRQPERAAEGSKIHGARPARDPNCTRRGSWRRCSTGLDQGNAGRVD
jgi:hypothetical protein